MDIVDDALLFAFQKIQQPARLLTDFYRPRLPELEDREKLERHKRQSDKKDQGHQAAGGPATIDARHPK
ncbi:hypothetical protein [Indioceanicola profundi]|uniref:hypothetical protein n=1 Tax=Indioceanicola profundi TaxID=2220096 RepID=UPI0013C4D18C|nr:hypothetical protein [Indioceanicola profundi]